MFAKGNDRESCHVNKDKIKSIAFGLYFLSPKAYTYVRSFVPLPSSRTIRRSLSNLPVSTGISNWMLKCLKMKMSAMGESSKHCVLCIDEMVLKPHLYYNITRDEVLGFVDYGNGRNGSKCKAALVLMVRGVLINWKQAIGYYFVKDSCPAAELANILNSALRKLMNLGMHVHCVVSDMGSNFQLLTKILGVTPSRPYFVVDEAKIFYIFDVPHMIKATRNNLLKYNFAFNDKVASWDDLISLYNKDKEQSLKLAVKLSENMMNPNNFMKMKVKYATKVFSHTVAAALDTHVRLGSISSDAKGTVDLISFINDLFDCLNSSSEKSTKMYHSGITESSPHIEFLKYSLDFAKGIKVVTREGRNVTKRTKCFYGWQLSISAVIQLWSRLNSQHNVKTLLTRRLNQDPLENFFGDIRNQGGNCQHPTPILFHSAFKKLLLSKVQNLSENGNCMADLDSYVTNVCDFSFIACQRKVSLEGTSLSIKTHDYRDKLLLENAEVYVSGYLMKKCLQRHQCDICGKYGMQNSVMVDPSQMFSMNKSFITDSFSKLTMPNAEFVKYLSIMNETFEKEFPKVMWWSRVGNVMLSQTQSIDFEVPCPLFPLDYCQKLFVRMKIYHALKNLNKSEKWNLKNNRKMFKLNADKN